MLVGACCEHEPADRGPRKGVTKVVVNVGDHDPHDPLEEREGVRRADYDGDQCRGGNCDEVIDRVLMLRREDHVLPPLVVHLVVLVELREVRDTVRHVEEELVHKRQQDVAARRGCVAGPVVGREAHGSVEEKVLARRENRDEDAVVEEEELERLLREGPELVAVLPLLAPPCPRLVADLILLEEGKVAVVNGYLPMR